MKSVIIRDKWSLIDVRFFELTFLTHWLDIEEIFHLHEMDSNVLRVHIDMVIEMLMMIDHNDGMEMKVYDASLSNYIDDDANMLVNSMDIAAEVVLVPHSLSFYTIFYKMTILDRKVDEEEKRDSAVIEEEKREDKIEMMRCICSVRREDAHMHSSFLTTIQEYTKHQHSTKKNEENNTHTHTRSYTHI